MKLARQKYFSIPGLHNNFSRFSTTSTVEEQNETGKSTVDYQEINNFAKLSNTWWDVYGRMKVIHSLNPLRIEFIRNGLKNTGFKETNLCQPLEGVKLLDVGCGGGILSESLAKMGAQVTGIDVSQELLTVAEEHAALDNSLASNLTYENISIEDFSQKKREQYDAVVASEILEHVINPKLFLKCCSEVLKPNGSIFITTQNRNLLSWFGAIVIAEYVLDVIPKGTHDWNKFITPDEMKQFLDECNCQTEVVQGLFYNPATNDWSLFFSTAVCYALHAVKQGKLTTCIK